MAIISPDDAKNQIEQGKAILIDVREADEFSKEHIGYALSVPLSRLKDELSSLKLPKSKQIIVQCLHGSRGQMALEIINKLDEYKGRVQNLEGGINGWKSHGFPVIKASSKSSSISLFRQVQIIVGFLVAFCVLLGFMGYPVGFGVAGFFGMALFFAGVSGFCGLAVVLGKMPWNQ